MLLIKEKFGAAFKPALLPLQGGIECKLLLKCNRGV